MVPGTPFEDEVLIRRPRVERRDGLRDRRRRPRRRRDHARRDDRPPRGARAGPDQRRSGRTTAATGCRSRSRPPSRSRRPARPRCSCTCKRVRHVGGRRAERLLELYGEDVLEVIDRDPNAAFRRIGLSAGRITEAVKSWDELRSSRALHLLLAPHGLAWLVPRIEKHYGAASPPHRARAPLRPDERVRDRVPDRRHDRALGRRRRRLTRARRARGVLHVLSEAERAGSTCLPVAELATRAGELLGAAPDAARFSEMADAGTLVIEVDEADEGRRHGLGLPPETAKLERDLAADRPDLAAAPASLKPSETPPGRRPRPRARAGRRGPRRLRLPPLDRHRRPGHGQDRDDPADLRGRRASRRPRSSSSPQPAEPPAACPSRAASTPQPSTPPSAGSPTRARPSRSSTPTS